MAQKKQISAVQGFTHGLVTDPDPRFQIKGSYSKALNVRLTNKSGDTFTIENIDGNTLAIDLFALQNQSYNASSDGGILKTRTDIAVAIQSQPTLPNDLVFSEIYFDPDNTDDNGNTVGLFYPSPQNPPGGLSPFSPSNLSISTSTSCQGIFPFFGGGLPSGSHL